MKRLLYPKLDVKTIYDIDFKKLYEQGLRGVIFDIDNTLVPYDQHQPSKENEALFKHLHDIGFKICLISNNNKLRVDQYNQALDMTAISNGLKPFRKNFLKALMIMSLSANQVIMVGDQMFTDVLGGNRVGLYTILVKPIQKKEQFITAIKRGIESLVYKRYLKYKGRHHD